MLPDAAKQVLAQAKGQGESAFQAILDSLEAILISRFPQFTTEKIPAMLDLKMADIRPTRFYPEAVAEGRKEWEAAVLLSLLTLRLGPLPEEQVAYRRALRLPRLAGLVKVVLDLADGAALAEWLAAHPVDQPSAPE